MQGTSFKNFFSKGTLTELSGIEKIDDKVTMLLNDGIEDFAFCGINNGGINNNLFLLHSEAPDPVIKYQVVNLIESNIPYCSVKKVDLERGRDYLGIKLLLNYRGYNIDYSTILGG